MANTAEIPIGFSCFYTHLKSEPGTAVHCGATGGTVTGNSLSAFYVVATPGSAASAAKHDETSMKSPVPHTLNLSLTPLACADTHKIRL